MMRSKYLQESFTLSLKGSSKACSTASPGAGPGNNGSKLAFLFRAPQGQTGIRPSDPHGWFFVSTQALLVMLGVPPLGHLIELGELDRWRFSGKLVVHIAGSALGGWFPEYLVG